jgi:hypothetical protein
MAFQRKPCTNLRGHEAGPDQNIPVCVFCGEWMRETIPVQEMPTSGWACPLCHRVWAPHIHECPGPHPQRFEELKK